MQTYDYQGKAAVARASPPPAANMAKATKSTTILSPSSIQPLSSYSGDMKRAAAKRTEEWADRPATVRRKETEKHVKRPLNSFMLYRSAYITVAKAQYPYSRQNDLSTIVAMSWHKEGQELHKVYDAYANIERCNHHSAYPRYKFSPQKLKIQKGGNNRKEEPMPISVDACSFDSCWPAASPVHSCALAPSPVSGELMAWQPIFLPMQSTGSYNGYGNHTIYGQIAGNSVPWPSAMTPSVFRGQYGATWAPTIGSMAFPTMPTPNGLPMADPSCSTEEMLASVNYTMPLQDPSYCIYCGRLCTSS